MKGAALTASRSRESDIGRPRDICWGLDVRRDAASRRQSAGTRMLATAGTPRPRTFFRCRGRSPGSQVVVSPLSSQCGAASVTSGRGETRCLQLRGQRPNLAWVCEAPAFLFATQTFKPADPGGYIWWYLPTTVNVRPRLLST